MPEIKPKIDKKSTKERGVECHESDCPCCSPSYEGECENCGAKPIVPVTGMCGPCTFGEADTAGGNW